MTSRRKEYTLPPNNPFLIHDSHYPTVHFNPAQTDVTRLPAWKGDWTLEPAQISWLPGVTTIGTSILPYPGGEHAIFFSGGNRIAKIRFTGGDFTLIDEVAIPGYVDKSISTTEIRQIVKQMQAAESDEGEYLQPFQAFLEKTEQHSATLMNGTYSLMHKERLLCWLGNHHLQSRRRSQGRHLFAHPNRQVLRS
jgi:hypothetical protein